VNTDTHPWVYTHIHTFISHWKRQDQRRKEEQTPLRCWAWLHVPLDTDGRTQDNCCFLFMEGPSATLHALFIWTLRKGQSQEPQGKRKMEPSLLYVWMCVYMKAKVHLSRWECTLIVQFWAPLFDWSFRIECVVCSAGVGSVWRGQAILFHWGLSHNEVMTAGKDRRSTASYYVLSYILETLRCIFLGKYEIDNRGSALLTVLGRHEQFKSYWTYKEHQASLGHLILCT